MPLVRFDQEPGYPDGAGTFHADDGSTFFGHDPEMAAQLSAPPPDERMAAYSDRADIDAIARDLAGGQQAPAPPPVASDVAPQMSQAPAQVTQASLRPEPAPPPQAAPPPQESPALGQAAELQGNIDRYAMRPVYVAPSRGGVVPTKQSEVRETHGMPYDPNGPEANDRANATINVNLAHKAQAEAEAGRAAGEAAAWAAALPELREKARVAQMRRDMQERQYRRDRDDLEQAMEQSNKSAASFNANRWFDDRGAIGGIGAGIAQAFGAGAAALTGGPNVVLQQLNSYIDRDVANQRAAIEADEKKANNALAQLNRQFGNLDQAEAALKIAQQNKVEQIAKSYAASTKSDDVLRALDVWLSENNQRHLANEQQFQNAAYGKTQLTTDAKVMPASAGGTRAPTEKEIQERYETLGKRGKVVEGVHEGEIKRQKALGMDPEKADQKSRLLIENADGSQVMAKSPEEATKIRDAQRLRVSAVRELNEIKKIANESATGGRAGEAKGRIRVLMKRALEQGNTMAGQGVFRTEDADYYTDALFGAGGGVRGEVIDELTGMFDHEYQSFVDAQRGSAVKAVETGSGQQVKYTGQAAKNPTAKGQFRQVGR